MAPETAHKPVTVATDAASVVNPESKKFERHAAQHARELEEDNCDSRMKKKLRTTKDNQEIAPAPMAATPETMTTMAAPSHCEGPGEMEGVDGMELVEETQIVHNKEQCEHPSSYQKDEDANKSQNEICSFTASVNKARSGTAGLNSSRWAPRTTGSQGQAILKLNDSPSSAIESPHPKKTGQRKPQKGDLVSFLNEICEREERERHRTRKLMELLLVNVEDALREPSEQARGQGCQAVLDLTNSIKAFVKSSVVCSLKPQAVHVTRGTESPQESTDAATTEGQVNHKKKTEGVSASSPRSAAPEKAPRIATREPPAEAGNTLNPEKERKVTPWAVVQTKRPKKATQKPSYAEAASHPQHDEAKSNQYTRAKPPVKETPAINRRRVFVRLPENAPQRELHPLVVVQRVNRHFPLGKGIETASTVRSGIALSLAKSTTPDEVLAHADQITHSLGGRVEKDETYMIIKVRGVDSRIVALDDNNVLTQRAVSLEKDLYPDIERAFGDKPHSALWGEILGDDHKSTLRLTFSKDSVRSRPGHIVLMGQRVKVDYPRTRENKAPLCKRCWAQHFTKECKGTMRCRTCGSEEHKSIEHPPDEPAHCVNCSERHPADSPSCPRALGNKARRRRQSEPNRRPQTQATSPGETPPEHDTEMTESSAPEPGAGATTTETQDDWSGDGTQGPVPW